MQRAIKAISNILLAVVLLVTSMGVTVNKHYCMGQLKDVSVFHEAESCMKTMKMEMKGGCSMHCCENITEEFKVEDFNKANFTTNLAAEYSLLAVITYVLIDFDLISLAESYTHYLNYKPPLIELDIPVLVQSFLL